MKPSIRSRCADDQRGMLDNSSGVGFWGRKMDGLDKLQDEKTMSAAIDLAIERHIGRSISETIDRIVTDRLSKSLATKVDEAVSRKVSNELSERIEHSSWNFENIFENKLIFGSRWILAPAYSILVIILSVLLYKAGEETWQLIVELKPFDHGRTIAQALVVVDIILVMNLLLMVMFVGYTNFVSKIHPSRAEDWPDWTYLLDYSGLKLQLLGSIIAISAIILLRELIDSAEQNSVPPMQAAITVALHLTFVVSALVVAIVNKLKHGKESASSNVGPSDV